MLSEGPHTLTLTGTDADGVSGSDTSTIVVRGPNQPRAVPSLHRPLVPEEGRG